MIASRHKMELVVLHCKPLARGLSDQHNPKHGNEWISVPKISTLFPRFFVRTSTQYTYMKCLPRDGQLTTIFARGRRVHRFSGYPKALSEDLPKLI